MTKNTACHFKAFYEFLKIGVTKTEKHAFIFGIVNIAGHLFFYIRNKYFYFVEYENVILRVCGLFFSILLIIYNKCNKCSAKSFNIVRLICLYASLVYLGPFFFTFMLLNNAASLEWQLNFLLWLALYILIMDWWNFVCIAVTGILLAMTIYLFNNNQVQFEYSLLYHTTLTSFCILLPSYFFTKNIKATEMERQTLLQNTMVMNVELQKRVVEVKQLLEAKTNLLNYISHEIRTPIHAIYNISQLVYENWEGMNDVECKKQVRNIANSSLFLTNLTTDLLDLSKFESGKMTYNFNKTDLVSLARDVVRQCKILYLYGKRLNITFKTHDKAAFILGDRMQIIRLLMNLFSNAIKYTDTGTITAILQLVDKAEMHYWQFSLIDQGIGIPEHQLQSIFDAFNRGEQSSSNIVGTGLGLAICSEIIAAHHGAIWAENNPKPQLGARFSFIIPALDYS